MEDNTIKTMAVCRSIPEFALYGDQEPFITQMVTSMLAPKLTPKIAITYIRTPRPHSSINPISMALASAMIAFREDEERKFTATIMCPSQFVAEQLCDATFRMMKYSDTHKTRATCRLGFSKVRFTYPSDLRSAVRTGISHVFVLFSSYAIPKRCIPDIYGALQYASHVTVIHHGERPEYYDERVDTIDYSELVAAIGQSEDK